MYSWCYGNSFGCGKAKLAKFIWNWKDVSGGDHSQNTCEVGVSGNCTFVKPCPIYHFIISDRKYEDFDTGMECMMQHKPWHKQQNFKPTIDNMEIFAGMYYTNRIFE